VSYVFRLSRCSSKLFVLPCSGARTILALIPILKTCPSPGTGDFCLGIPSRYGAWVDQFVKRRSTTYIMSLSIVRVLVVDDYEPFRHFVRLTFGKNPAFQIVGEASDGLEAVRQAKALQPDLIFLDIGLPMLNGIAAARQIRELAPSSKIIFVTQEFSAGVLEEAFSCGARGYVLKARAGVDLPAAVEAVLAGSLFLGSRL
jgi:CheY-like chemotaxis protein